MISDICHGRRGHCPWRQFLSCGDILDVETIFVMWRNSRCGEILDGDSMVTKKLRQEQSSLTSSPDFEVACMNKFISCRNIA